MIDTTKPLKDYLNDTEITQIIEQSKKLFISSKKEDYKIVDDQVIKALKFINESDDYVKIIWRVQQENPNDERFFDIDYLLRGITNLKMFYSLEAIDGKNLHSLSKTLDEFWHAHQNFSFEYMNFCNKVFGSNQFLHHTPTDKRNREIQESMVRRYVYSQNMIDKIYQLDSTFWGKDIVICCSYNAISPEGFIFWKPALNAIEPACNIYNDSTLNQELRKSTNFVFEGFSSIKKVYA